MHTRASNYELVEPLPEPERTLNRRLRRQNRRVPFDQRNNPPQHPRIVYPSILDINYFHHFLDILRNYDPMDDEPMWAADRVVAPTPGFAITIPETVSRKQKHDWMNSMKELSKHGMKFKLLSLADSFPSALFNRLLGEIRAFSQHENESLTDAWLQLQSRAKQPTPDLDDDDMPMSREEEAKFMQTFHKTRFYNDYYDRDSNCDNWRSSEQNDYNRDNYRSNTDDKSYDLQRQFNNFMKSQQSTNDFVNETFMDLKTQLETVAKNHQALIQNLESKFDRLADKQSGRPSRSLPSNTQPNPRGRNSKAYQPLQALNEHVNAVFTRSGKSYNPPDDQQNNSKNPINVDSDDEDNEPTPQPKTQPTKPVKETPLPKPYKPKIPYPQRLRKEKIEAQYGKFLDMIQAVRINIPLVDVLSGMPNYGKFLKELISNKHKIEQISVAFLRDKSSAMIQNKVPPKLEDPGSFLIPCNFNKNLLLQCFS
ncbi:hypothetical protein Tco_0721656 [Tanacetum coccineum]